jgi:transcriptional regulator GlxA family with amidase domain
MPDRTIFDPLPYFDTIILPGGLGIFDLLEDSTLSDWLSAQRRAARRICAICNGVFAFGAAGLLDGRTVTTHWMDAGRLATMFPRAHVEPDRIYVKDQALYTTAGVTAGIDLALVLIEEDIDRTMALDVAKYLVVPLRRAGGQSQFSPLLEIQASSDTTTSAVQQYLFSSLEQDHSVASVAEKMGISSRHLSRSFKKESGVTLMDFLGNARLDAVRRYLENSELGIGEIARLCGFANASSLRRVFQRRLELSPLEYRQRFRADLAVA